MSTIRIHYTGVETLLVDWHGTRGRIRRRPQNDVVWVFIRQAAWMMETQYRNLGRAAQEAVHNAN